MIRNGKDLEELRELLHDLDQTTVLEGSLLTSRNEAVITATRKNGSFIWNAELLPTSRKGGGQRVFGKGYKKLMSALETINSERSCDVSLSVLALSGIERARTWDNKLITHWIMVPPCDPYQMVANEPKFQKIRLELTDEEYEVCVESYLAFYDEIEEILYPIRKCAFDSVGRMMDCAASFKYRTTFPLGSALLLAERLAKTHSIRFLYRNRTEKVCPLISIVGNNYSLYGQQRFVDEALELIQKEYVCHIDRWVVTDEKTTVTVALSLLDSSLGLEIDLQIGDVMGTSLAVTAYARVGAGRLFRCRNSAYHKKSFEGTTSLFEGIFECISQFSIFFFEQKYRGCYFHKEDAAGIGKVLGSSRFKRVVLPQTGEHCVFDLMLQVITATYCRLGEKQAMDLAKEYSALYNKLVKREVIQLPKKKQMKSGKKVV